MKEKIKLMHLKQKLKPIMGKSFKDEKFDKYYKT